MRWIALVLAATLSGSASATVEEDKLSIEDANGIARHLSYIWDETRRVGLLCVESADDETCRLFEDMRSDVAARTKRFINTVRTDGVPTDAIEDGLIQSMAVRFAVVDQLYERYHRASVERSPRRVPGDLAEQFNDEVYASRAAWQVAEEAGNQCMEELRKHVREGARSSVCERFHRLIDLRARAPSLSSMLDRLSERERNYVDAEALEEGAKTASRVKALAAYVIEYLNSR